MTDFIHEQPREETNPAPPREEPPMDEKTGQKRVYGYIFILFVVAFGLLLWSYAMNQRSADEVLSELRGNADALQTTLERNVELERRTDELEALLTAANEESEDLRRFAAQQEQAFKEEQERANANALLWELEYRFAHGEYDACRDIAGRLKLVVHALGTGGDDTPSALARYEEIVHALGQ